jgi:galactitol-specific phosphotransferase system IIB component
MTKKSWLSLAIGFSCFFTMTSADADMILSEDFSNGFNDWTRYCDELEEKCFNAGIAEGVQEGINRLKTNRNARDAPNLFIPQSEVDAKTKGVQEGINEVKTNPNDYELFTQGQKDDAKAEGVQEGINKVNTNPNAYDLFTQSQKDDAKAKGVQEGKAIGVLEGIDKVKSNPSDYEFFNQAQKDVKAAGVQEGMKEVQNNHEKYGLFTQAQVDKAKAAGVQEGIDKVKTNPSDYGLFTKAQVDDAFQNGIDKVKTNPSDYGLFTQAQVDDAFQNGIDEVKTKPNEYDLFTQAEVDDAFQNGIDEVKTNLDVYELIPKTVILIGGKTYQVGDTLDVKLKVSQKSHLQKVDLVDLWVIIKLPEKFVNGFVYMTGEAFSPFSFEPVPFQRSKVHLEKMYSIFPDGIEASSDLVGEYIFYAFFSQAGSELDSLFSILHSNVAKTKVIISNQSRKSNLR